MSAASFRFFSKLYPKHPIVAFLPRYSYKIRHLYCSTTVNFQANKTSTHHQKISKKFTPFPFEYHQEIELNIEDLTNLGEGIGRYRLADGAEWVVMVPSVLPGETVLVRIYKNHASYSEADLVKVIVPSNDRVVPPCPYFQICGGCQYQHMNIRSQREWKRNQVKNLLQRIGGIENVTIVNAVVGSDDLYGYRSKITPHYDRPDKSNASELDIGFQRRGSRQIVDIEKCIIASPPINEAYEARRNELKAKLPAERTKLGATLLFRETDHQHVTTNFKEIVTQTVCGIQFQYKAGEFFQNNAYVLPMMIEHVSTMINQYHTSSSNNNSTSNTSSSSSFLVDAYCGSGLFSLCLSKHFTEVFGVEISDAAVNAARNNAQLNEIRNVQFLCGSSEAIFSKIQHLPKEDTVMIIDPPRKGCDMIFLAQLFTFQPRTIVYVSCDPATQARDTKEILANGYEILDVTPFDLFPQTRHIENVITYRLKKIKK